MTFEMLVLLILLAVFYGMKWSRRAVPVLRKAIFIYKVLRCKKQYQTEVVGEVIGSAQENGREELYCAAVRYTVDGRDYEIEAGDFGPMPAVIGRRALVIYDPYDPLEGYVWPLRKFKKHLKVLKRDGEYVHCSYGLFKNIKIPVELVEEQVVPGSFIVHKYGFYHLEDRNDRKPTSTEIWEDTLDSLIDEEESE